MLLKTLKVLIFLACLKREFAARFANKDMCMTPWRRTILGLADPSGNETKACSLDSEAIVASEMRLAHVVIFGPCKGSK